MAGSAATGHGLGSAESSIMEADAKIAPRKWRTARAKAVAALLSVPEWRVQGALWKINQQACATCRA